MKRINLYLLHFYVWCHPAIKVVCIFLLNSGVTTVFMCRFFLG